MTKIIQSQVSLNITEYLIYMINFLKQEQANKAGTHDCLIQHIAHREEALKYFQSSKGECAGIATLWAYSKYIEAKILSGSIDEESNPFSRTHLQQVLSLLADTDNFESLTPLQHLDIETLISNIRFYQQPSYTWLNYQKSSEKQDDNAQLDLAQTLQDTQNRAVQPIAKINFTVSEAVLANKLSKIINPGLLIFLGGYQHVRAIFCNSEEELWFFDPNGEEVKCNSIESLVKTIFKSRRDYSLVGIKGSEFFVQSYTLCVFGVYNEITPNSLLDKQVDLAINVIDAKNMIIDSNGRCFFNNRFLLQFDKQLILNLLSDKQLNGIQVALQQKKSTSLHQLLIIKCLQNYTNDDFDELLIRIIDDYSGEIAELNLPDLYTIAKNRLLKPLHLEDINRLDEELSYISAEKKQAILKLKKYVSAKEALILVSLDVTDLDFMQQILESCHFDEKPSLDVYPGLDAYFACIEQNNTQAIPLILDFCAYKLNSLPSIALLKETASLSVARHIEDKFGEAYLFGKTTRNRSSLASLILILEYVESINEKSQEDSLQDLKKIKSSLTFSDAFYLIGKVSKYSNLVDEVLDMIQQGQDDFFSCNKSLDFQNALLCLKEAKNYQALNKIFKMDIFGELSCDEIGYIKKSFDINLNANIPDYQPLLDTRQDKHVGDHESSPKLPRP